MSIKLKPITETSWLVLGDTEEVRIGLLSEIRDQYVLMVKGVKQRFLDRKELTDFFNEDIFNNIVEIEKKEEPKDFFINGFPVDFATPFQVFATGIDLPLYSKRSNGEVYYCAGYYCLGFQKDWMGAYCPKLTTLQTYQYKGPFKTEQEMKVHLRRLRRERVESRK